MDIVAALTGYTQHARHLQLDSALPTGSVVVERFHGREAVSESFRFEIDVLSPEPYLDLEPLLGTPARLRLSTDAGPRCWNGYLTAAALTGEDGGLTRYRLVMESALAFLRLRRNCLYFTDLDTRGLIDRVFGDHPELRWRYELGEPLRTFPLAGQYRELDLDFILQRMAAAGLSFRIEHAQDAGSDPEGNATVVVFDRKAAQAPADAAQVPFHLQDVGAPDGTTTFFSERHQRVTDRVVAASWNTAQVKALAGRAQAPADPDAPPLPELEVFEGHVEGRFDTLAQAQQYAEQRLAALQLPKRMYHGSGATRTIEIGKVHTLTGYLDEDVDFVPLSLEHEAVNNLGPEIAQRLGAGELDQGLYRNRFAAVPPNVPIVPPYRYRANAHGVQTAIVTGLPDSAVTSSRDHQVRIQFPWQRGEAPLPGGLGDTASRSNPAGHAPGNHEAGTWVPVAEQIAGPNYGHAFLPRVGAEVVVGFRSGDVGLPVVLGQVYGGRVQPPFAAGDGSQANHPGTLSGLQSQTLDGQPGTRWVMDDAPGQLRHELLNSTASSKLATGYLIDQDGAARGGYRGEGFELITQGWAVARAGQGLLASSTLRANGASTQLDAAESVAQLKAATAAAQRLDDSATQAQANGLAANPAQQALHQALDPKQDGKYTGAVAGQSATKPTAEQRSGGDPVERFGTNAILFESSDSLVLTTPNSAVAYAAEHLHLTSNDGDTHLAAGATFAGAAGDAVSLYSAEGGVKAYANHGPVSVEAHTGAMDLLADQSVQIVSTEARIDVLAKDKIVLQAGASTITLEGMNITFRTPGQFLVKFGQHDVLGPQNSPAVMPHLPQSQTAFKPGDLILRYAHQDGTPVHGAPYEAVFADGSKRRGRLDEQGYAKLDGVPPGAVKVHYGEDTRKDPLGQADPNPLKDWMS